MLGDLGGDLLFEVKFFSLSLLFGPSLIQGLASGLDLHRQSVCTDWSTKWIWRLRVIAGHEDGDTSPTYP
jgi:hypothetical protein